jgi:serine/threonine-protein kinase
VPPLLPTPLSAADWVRVNALFAAVLEQPVEARPAFLQRACAGDGVLLDAVQALLAVEAEAREALGESVSTFAAPLFSDLADLPEEALPETDAYRLLREVGRGGMGTVYLAERVEDGHRVALKVVRRGMDTDEVLRRFRQERRILAALDHPHIARLYDGGMTRDGRPYLVMEYIDGQSLTAYADARRLDLDARLRLFQPVCEAVRFAHQNLVVHRDLKPSNILVTDGGQVKLLDFGIARLLGDDLMVEGAPHTRTGVRLMTPEYASPEQHAGARVTTASDVFALGMVLYELLTGRRPFEAGDVPHRKPERPSMAVARAEERHRPDGTTETILPEVRSQARSTTTERLRRRLRGDLDTILLTALRTEPERRYPSAEAFLEDIRRHLASLPVTARPDTPGYRARKFLRRHRYAVLTGLAILGLVVGFAGFYTVRVTQERNRAEQEAAKLAQVRTFLSDLFEAADPGEARGQTFTAQDLLNRGAGRLAALSGQPDVQAELTATIGDLYRKLGRYDSAAVFLHRALALRQALHRGPHPEVARALYGLSRLEYDLSRYDSARVLIETALAMQRTLLEPPHPDLAQSLNGLALIHFVARQYTEAEPLFRESLAMYRTLYGEEHAAIGRILNNLSTLAYARGDIAEAEQLCREALAIRRKLLGEVHPDVALSLRNLARFLHERGAKAEAERLYQEALAMRRALFGPSHPDVARSLRDLARFLEDTGRYSEANPLLEQAVAMGRVVLGPEHLTLALYLGEYATLLHQQARHQDAEPLYREARALYARRLPAHDPMLIGSTVHLGRCLMAQRRFAEAEAVLLESHTALATMTDTTASVREEVPEALAALYRAWGKPDQAVRFSKVP